MATATPESRSIVLFVRALSPAVPPTEDHVDTVHSLADSDRIESVSISVWGREIGLSTTAQRTDAGTGILERVGEFRSWARENGLEMDPFFETREVQSNITGEEYTSLSLPVCCLAEYEGEELVHVAPYCNDRAVCTVDDRLGMLEETGPKPEPSESARRFVSH